jgi:hypothetical protein
MTCRRHALDLFLADLARLDAINLITAQSRWGTRRRDAGGVPPNRASAAVRLLRLLPRTRVIVPSGPGVSFHLAHRAVSRD